MLKVLFAVLLLANGVLFAYQQGHLNELLPNGREPARMQRQLHADKVMLVSPESLQAAQDSCVEIGNFTPTEVKRLEPQLAALLPEQAMARRDIVETSSHMVLIPPQGGRSAAERRAAGLRQLGITDFYVLQEASDQRWGISLGIFKSEEGANARLAAVTQQGVRNAVVVERQMPLYKFAFQLRGNEKQIKEAAAKFVTESPRYEARACA